MLGKDTKVWVGSGGNDDLRRDQTPKWLGNAIPSSTPELRNWGICLSRISLFPLSSFPLISLLFLSCFHLITLKEITIVYQQVVVGSKQRMA